MSRQKGMSVVEVSIALAMMAFAGLAIGAVINHVSVQERTARLQVDLDATHMQLVHALERLDNLREIFEVGEGADSPLKRCLTGKGNNCTSFETALAPLDAVAGTPASRKGQILGACAFPNSNCPIEQRASFSWSCADGRECLMLNLTIESRIRSPGNLVGERKASLKVPARSLVSRGKIAFDCTSSSLLFAIDYNRLSARCENLSGSLASLYTMPLRTFASTTPSEVTNPPEETGCPNGVRALNLFASRKECGTSTTTNPEGPTDNPKVDETCDPASISALSEMMIQRLPESATTIATTCIDGVTPTLEMNMPGEPFRTARFMNTCGNRHCRSKGFDSGRVIELNGDNALLECRYSQPPATFQNACKTLLVSSSGLMTNVPITTDQIATECIDAAVPDFAANRNFTASPDAYGRFMQTCGKRACQNRQYNDGRVIESYGNDSLLECYNSPSELFVPKTSTIEDVARNCIDSANPELSNNMPGGGQSDRFSTTCGDRYCRNVLNFRSGRVVEFTGGQAWLTCVR
ncbi:MAG: hypothetical protein KF681_08085 [Bdellovibrionaceae bacterium]|nr:hypothetical protein [Pseudobdellovibrionaceae bacterium]